MSDLALTVWKDGTWQVWSRGDACYAQNDPSWLTTIPLAQIDAVVADPLHRDAVIGGQPVMLPKKIEAG